MLQRLGTYLGLLILPVVSLGQANPEEPRREKLAGLHFAGSTGFLSASGGISSLNGKFEWSAGYGYVPKSKGGTFHALFAKAAFLPLRLNVWAERLSWQPIQTGAFLSQSFGEGMGMSWGPQYPDRYYWWTRSLRGHLFVSTQLNWKFQDPNCPVSRIAFFFEANTNDLYISSYSKNRNSLSLYDILFFGFGTKLYWK